MQLSVDAERNELSMDQNTIQMNTNQNIGYEAELPLRSSSSHSSINKLSSNSMKQPILQTNQKNLYEIPGAFIQFLRVLFSTIYLVYIILTIPLSFEVGGLNCGLSYSLTILILYFCLATLRVLKYHRFISSFLYYLQHLFLPTLLSFFLTLFNNNNNNNNTSNLNLNSSIINLSNATIFEKIWWNYMIEFWKFFLINSTPLFTILEGFCSLLSVQAIGQLFKYFIKNKSDIWSILNLILSSCVLSTSIYFAGKIYVSPLIDLEHVGLIGASLLGSVFTLTILITFYAIYFNRATTLESSLMVAYIVKCCYELFPELSKNNISSLFKFIFNEFKKIDNQAKQSLTLNKKHIKFSKFLNYFNLNDIIIKLKLLWTNEEIVTNNFLTSKFPKFTNLLLEFIEISQKFNKFFANFILEHFPRSFEPLWDFLKISINNLTFSILIQLAYRITVFFAATKIIPILSPMNRVSNTQQQTQTQTQTQNQQQQSTSSRLIYLYSPCIIIAVYTNLMIQYNYEIEKETHLYSWLHNKFYEFFFSNSYNNNNNNSDILTTVTAVSNKIFSTTTTASSSINGATSAIGSQVSLSLPPSLFTSIHTWQFWNWINIFAVLLLYFSELVSYDPEDSALTDHWN